MPQTPEISSHCAGVILIMLCAWAGMLSSARPSWFSTTNHELKVRMRASSIFTINQHLRTEVREPRVVNADLDGAIAHQERHVEQVLDRLGTCMRESYNELVHHNGLAYTESQV